MAYDLNTASEGRHTVTALFESAGDAEKARADLVSAGFPPNDVITKSGVEHAAASEAPRSQSVLKSLLDIFIFMPPHEKPTYEEALRRGGVAVVVQTPSESYERAIDILDRDGAIDLDERQAAWQSEGWTPDRSASRPGGPGSPEQAGFESANSHDPLVNPDANRDMRERIGVGTSDMAAGIDIDPPNAATPGSRDTPFASNANQDMRERIGVGTSDMTAGTDLDPPSAASARETGWVRDLSHGRSRVRSYRGVQPRG